MKTNVDFISNGQGHGAVAQMLLSQGKLEPAHMKPFIGSDGKPYISVFSGGDASKPENYKNIQVNAGTLRRDEWKLLDEAVLKISESELNGVQDLISKGLTYNAGGGMANTVFEWHDVSDALEAVLTMDGVTRGENDQVVYQYNYLPLPIIHVDYEINARHLASSRNKGQALDTTMAERAARKVGERLENMLFTDTSYSYGALDERNRNTIYSYLNHPDRNQKVLGLPWDESSKSPREILRDVQEMKQTLVDVFMNGPYTLYIPTNYETVMDNDYEDTGTTATGMTVKERILKLTNLTDVKVVNALPADTVLLVQMTSNVVRLVRAMGVQNLQWGVEGNMITKYKVMTIQVPQIRSDANSVCGIVHASN